MAPKLRYDYGDNEQVLNAKIKKNKQARSSERADDEG